MSSADPERQEELAQPIWPVGHGSLAAERVDLSYSSALISRNGTRSLFEGLPEREPGQAVKGAASSPFAGRCSERSRAGGNIVRVSIGSAVAENGAQRDSEVGLLIGLAQNP